MSDAVELVLDLRGTRATPTNSEEYKQLWDDLEPALHGCALRQRRVHELDGPDGEIRLEVVWLPEGFDRVTPDTVFSVVAVRERPRLHYRCKECQAVGESRYAPFVCTACPSDTRNNRVCDQHVVILDGSLTPTCPEHRPSCRGCGAPAVFRCAGKACRRERAWCAAHRRAHPRDPDVDYCPSCFDEAFPRCEQPHCQDVGTVRCEHFSRSFEQCERRMCTRHAMRWQVFGGERIGLGQCDRHRVRGALDPSEVVFRIITGAALRKSRERLPSLQGFAHTLRRFDPDLATDYPGIRRLLEAEGNTMRGNRAATAALERARHDWDRQLDGAAALHQQGLQLVERLRALVIRNDGQFGHELAAALVLAEYKAARNSRPAMLFVKLRDDLRGRFVGRGGAAIRSYSEQLGVRVQLEGSQRGPGGRSR
ncbi:hypothetical protein [Kutzneria kofuensis]|uniref:K Homology domain-containing protein n=1 Tax=Kutzneria kofuensis TaxID=103725 RepID=A0A7W9KQ97_9PSEU|nr:hypothetical protein [Kutzneria kofuensis]MBB5896746.1 hypothetical protein [Kutzneria kofuensis]